VLRFAVASLAVGGMIAACGAFGAAEAPEEPADAAAAARDGGHDGGNDAGMTTGDGATNTDAALTCTAKCDAWAACEGTSCVNVAQPLDGLRFEMPCNRDSSPCLLTGPTSPPNKSVTLGGTPGALYDLVVRVRGVVEQKTYNGATKGPATGTHPEFFVSGGTPRTDIWNVYEVLISDPAWNWFLNSGASEHQYSDIIDYNATMRVRANASIAVHVDSFDQNEAAENGSDGRPLQVPDLSLFRGQFVQFNLVSVSLAPPQ
jgi:hypothetical protein